VFTRCSTLVATEQFFRYINRKLLTRQLKFVPSQLSSHSTDLGGGGRVGRDRTTVGPRGWTQAIGACLPDSRTHRPRTHRGQTTHKLINRKNYWSCTWERERERGRRGLIPDAPHMQWLHVGRILRHRACASVTGVHKSCNRIPMGLRIGRRCSPCGWPVDTGNSGNWHPSRDLTVQDVLQIPLAQIGTSGCRSQSRFSNSRREWKASIWPTDLVRCRAMTHRTDIGAFQQSDATCSAAEAGRYSQWMRDGGSDCWLGLTGASGSGDNRMCSVSVYSSTYEVSMRRAVTTHP